MATTEMPMRIYAPGQFEADTLPGGEYRELVIRMCKETGEMASNPEFLKNVKILADKVDLAPTAADRVRMASFYADEMRHGYIFESLLVELGYDTTDPANYTSIEALNLIDQITTWCDLAVFNAIMDRAGGVMLRDYTESSYGPLGRAGAWVARDERGHANMGVTHLRWCLENLDDGFEQANESLKRWYPMALDFFGRSNSTRQWRYIELGFRTKTNEQLRQEYTEEVNSVLEGLGLAIPDPMANRHFV